MAGFFSKLTSIPPANGVSARFMGWFELNRNNGVEPFPAMVDAWEKTIEPYKTSEPALYFAQHESKMSHQFCQTFSILDDAKTGARHASRVLASMCYPAFGETCKDTWQTLFKFIELEASASEVLNRKFQELNPITADTVGAPFSFERSQLLSDIIVAWVKAHNVRII